MKQARMASADGQNKKQEKERKSKEKAIFGGEEQCTPSPLRNHLHCLEEGE